MTAAMPSIKIRAACRVEIGSHHDREGTSRSAARPRNVPSE